MRLFDGDRSQGAGREVVSEEHRTAAEAERERSQSATKFFTPVHDTSAQPTEHVTRRTHRHAPPEPHQPQQPQQTQQPQRPQQPERPHGPELPAESTVQLVLDLALRIGEVQMGSGAGAADTTATILAVTNAYGLPHCEVDVIFSSITVSVHRGTDVNPITAVRLVRTRGNDYTRLEDTEALLRRITSGKVRVYEASAELYRLTSAPHPYPRWTATLAWAGMAAAIALLIGGGGLDASITAVITAAIDRLGRFLNRQGLPAFFQQLIGGLVATFLALLLVRSDLFEGLNDSSFLVGAAITVLLSGLSVVSTVQDAITGYYVTAAGRTVEIALSSAGLIAGVVIGLRLAAYVGVAHSTNLPPYTPDNPFRLPLLTFAGAAAAAFFALASYARARTLAVTAAAGALGAISFGALQLAHFGPIASSGLAAVVIGFAGGLLARRLRIPPVIVAIAGLVPLLPGLSTYRSLFYLAVDQKPSTGTVALVIAATTALALGAGVVLGEFLAQPVRTRLGRLERRFNGPRLAGPLRPARRKIE